MINGSKKTKLQKKVRKWLPLRTGGGSGRPGGGEPALQLCVLRVCGDLVQPRTSLRVAEVRQGHGVELPSVCDGSVQEAAAAARITVAQTNMKTTKLSPTISHTLFPLFPFAVISVSNQLHFSLFFFFHSSVTRSMFCKLDWNPV